MVNSHIGHVPWLTHIQVAYHGELTYRSRTMVNSHTGRVPWVTHIQITYHG